MQSDSKHSSGVGAAAQQRFLSLFLRSEREVFRYVAALVPNVADAEDIVQQTALTLSAWVSVKGLDRPFNSLFMCDGFERGKIHWQIRNDGVLDLGVQGSRRNEVQIFASPAVVGFNQFGQWMHLAVVVDGENRQVVHYVNGTPVSRHKLQHPPPYRLGPAELGNWNPGEFPHKPPFLIRQFSGAMDEFALFNRALSDGEIRQLYTEGEPQPNPERLLAERRVKN